MKVKKNSLIKFALLFCVITFQVNAQSISEGLRNLKAERYTAAGKVFTQLAASDPTAENLFYLGLYYLSTPEASTKENLAKAQEAFDKGVLTDKKGDPLNTVGLGMVKYAQKDFAGAKLLFDQAIKNTKSKNPTILSRVGEAYEMFDWVNDPAEAVKYADQAIEISKNLTDPLPYLVKAAAYYRMNEGGDAMNALENALRLSNDKASVYAEMGRIWMQGKNWSEAKTALDKALEADKEYATTYKYLASYNQIYQKWEAAADAAKKYLQYSDGDCGAKLRYAQYAFIGKDFDNVLKTVDEIQSCNKNPIAQRLAGISRYELGQPKEAITTLKNYIEIAPKEDVMGLDYGFIGRSYFAIPDADMRAINDSLGLIYIEKAVAMGDTTFDYYGNAADLFKERKQYNKAAAMYEKALTAKKSPDGGDYANLGILYLQLKNYEKADPIFDKVVELYKGAWPDAYYFSAFVKSYKNTADTTYPAAERWKEYLAALPDDQKPARKAYVIQAYNYLAGKALHIDKDTAKAIEYLNETLKYDPENQLAKETLQSLTAPDASTTTTTPANGNGGGNRK